MIFSIQFNSHRCCRLPKMAFIIFLRENCRKNFMAESLWALLLAESARYIFSVGWIDGNEEVVLRSSNSGTMNLFFSYLSKLSMSLSAKGYLNPSNICMNRNNRNEIVHRMQRICTAKCCTLMYHSHSKIKICPECVHSPDKQDFFFAVCN